MISERELDEPNQDARVKETTIQIPMQDGHTNEARVYTNVAQSSKPRALVVLFHGGGWIGGTNRQMSFYSRPLAILHDAIIVNPSYRLAPEHKFPAAHHDAWDTVKWLAANAKQLGADPTQGFIVGGSSAGASLTIVTASRAVREKLSPPITGLWVSIPPLFSENTVPEKHKDLWFSREQNAKAPFFGANELEFALALYGPDFESRDFNPLTDKDSIPGHPSAFVQVAGLDPLRDDGLIYEKVLSENGVPTRLDVYKGMPHGFFGSLMTHLKQGRKCHINTIAGFGWLLKKDVDLEKTKEDIKEFKFFQE